MAKQPLQPLLLTGAALVASPFALYAVMLGFLAIPAVQRHALYAHRINTLRWSNINQPESWGFAINQVTPFTLDTPDGENIYAWHITPLPLYLKNEAALSKQTLGLCPNFEKTESFRLLKQDAEARLILYCKPGAAMTATALLVEFADETASSWSHIAQAFRPDTYHALTDTSSYHLIAIDYRGFGHSTGIPSEQGLIQDASALVDWAINVAGISPSRIVLLGHSLGTAVVSGVAEKYALQNVEFAGIVLVAGFSDLASMLSGYRMGGLVPVMGPFAAWPGVLQILRKLVVDSWHSANRLSNIVRHTKKRLRLSLIHAENDRDIPWTEDNKLFRSAVNGTMQFDNDAAFEKWKEERTIRKGSNAFVTTWTSDPDIVVRQELFPYGRHDPITGYAPVALAVMRSFDYGGTPYA